MYADWGGAPAAGVVTAIGTVGGRRHMIIANDATVKAGAFFPMTAKKVLRAPADRLRNRLPLVYLVDSAGVFLPLQEEVFPDEDDFGRIFRNNAVISAAGIPQYRGHHGQLRRRRRLSARAVRQAADDRGLGPVSGRAGAGERRDRPGGLARRAGRRGDARRRSAARSTFASRTTRRAWSACGGWSTWRGPMTRSRRRRSSRKAAAEPRGRRTICTS